MIGLSTAESAACGGMAGVRGDGIVAQARSEDLSGVTYDATYQVT
jgi:hypothetical protein